ncbi:urease accessory protein [Rhodopseudomonas julia]|uniref:Urease accessory protein UreF n=1 Tax=Rhodopseudomonas julia TaxID=200617 RepID=A0ABU0C1L5_9BRAD|nr:urease accessory UreF family protein [Rhodopseudomonas julia]MDQ0324402.1 urease accessory protein [Rhodopseudomonas julia]
MAEGAAEVEAGSKNAAAALVTLQYWLSPAFPVGAYAYSHGLERAVAAGWVNDRQSLETWLKALLRCGSFRADAVLFAAAFRARKAGNATELAEIAELAEALAPSRERHLETMAQGRAFAEATGDTARPWPVAVGAAAADLDIELVTAVASFLQAAIVNLCSVAQRSVPIGQTDALAVVTALREAFLETAAWAAAANLAELGSATFFSDIASMQHEVQETRLFRS